MKIYDCTRKVDRFVRVRLNYMLLAMHEHCIRCKREIKEKF